MWRPAPLTALQQLPARAPRSDRRVTDDRPLAPAPLPAPGAPRAGRRARRPRSASASRRPACSATRAGSASACATSATSRPGTRSATRTQRDRLDAWMEAARERRAAACCSASSTRCAPSRLRRTLPTARAVRARSSGASARAIPACATGSRGTRPTTRSRSPANRPRRAARYFDAIAWNCRGCRIVAADVLDVSGMTRWVRRFQRHAVHRPRIWGLHNYVDANRFTAGGTRALLRVTRGKVWFTETGGLVLRREYAGGRDHARVPLLAAPRGAGDDARAAARLPQPPDPARLPLPLAGAVPGDELGLRVPRAARRGAARRTGRCGARSRAAFRCG